MPNILRTKAPWGGVKQNGKTRRYYDTINFDQRLADLMLAKFLLRRAFSGWLANVPTDPCVAAVVVHGEQAVVRLSEESKMEPFSSLNDFLNQVSVVCQPLRFDRAQTSYLLTRARDLLD